MENGWLSSFLPGPLEIQGVSSGKVTLLALLAVGSGLDETTISLSGQRGQTQADRWLAPGLEAERPF